MTWFLTCHVEETVQADGANHVQRRGERGDETPLVILGIVNLHCLNSSVMGKGERGEQGVEGVGERMGGRRRREEKEKGRKKGREREGERKRERR